MKDVKDILYTKIYDTISSITTVYSAVPNNVDFPYVYVGNTVMDEATSSKDRFFTYGTIDVVIYTKTFHQGSKSELFTLTNSIKQALKATKSTTLDLSPNFNMTVWYISNEVERTETTKNIKTFINTIQYYFEIEQI